MNPSLISGISSQAGYSYQERRIMFTNMGKFMGRFSEQLFLFALTWYLLSTTHSAVQVGIFLICGAVPVALFNPLGAIVMARNHRLKLLAALNLFRSILILILAGALYSHSLSIWLLDTITAILALGAVIYNSADTANPPNMIIQDQSSPAVVEPLWINCGALAGILAGGFLYRSPGVPFILMICAIAYMIAVLLECWVPLTSDEMNPTVCKPAGQLPVRTMEDNIQNKRPLWIGFTYLAGHRELLLVVGFSSVMNLLLYPAFTILIPYIFKIVLKLSAMELALVQGAYLAGAVIGISVITAEIPPKRLRTTLLTNSAIIGILILLAALPLLPGIKVGLTVWSIMMIYIILAVFWGLATIMINIQAGRMVSNRLGEDLSGQAGTFIGSIMAITVSIGFLTGGYLAQVLPGYWLFTAIAAGMGLIAIIFAVKR